MAIQSRLLPCLLACCALAVPALVFGARDNARFNADRLLDDIRYLASPALGGRASGSPGLTKAADYIAAQFSRAGVKPVSGTGYLQSFNITSGATLRPGNTMQWSASGVTHNLELTRDFEPFPFSSSGSVAGNVVFAGYGITACEYGYDDYSGIDAHGKIVVVLRHEPQEYESSSLFEGRVYTEHSQTFRKLLNAKEHGATAVLFVNDAANHSGPDVLEKMTALPSPGSAGLPFVGVHSETVDKWFEFENRSLSAAEAEIDKTLEPASFAFSKDLIVTLRTAVESEQKPIANVIGYVPGETSEYVIIGAHYDHLGLGEQYSLAPSLVGTIHPGADDNASGTAGVMALARWFSGQQKLRRGFLFVTFAGEEIGLLGSTWLTAHPVLPLEHAVAMINMDMIGRMRDRSVMVGGAATGTGLREILDEAAKHFPVELNTSTNVVYGSSDHTAFTARGIPSLFFFTGLHADYHRPGDTPDKIDPRSIGTVVNLVSSVATALAQTPQHPRFHTTPRAGSCGTEENTHKATASGR